MQFSAAEIRGTKQQLTFVQFVIVLTVKFTTQHTINHLKNDNFISPQAVKKLYCVNNR